MLCTSCGTQNPDVNRFCGMCGALLDRRGASRRSTERRRATNTDNVVPMRTPEIAPEQPAPPSAAPRDAYREPATAAAANFGGYAGDDLENDEPPVRERGERATGSRSVHGPSFLGLDEPTDSTYLFDEDEPRSHTRGWLLLVLLLALGTLAFMQWRSGDPNTLTARVVNALKERMYGAPRPQASEPVAGHTDSANGESASGDANAAKPADQKPASDTAPVDEHGTATPDTPQKQSEQQGKGAEAKKDVDAPPDTTAKPEEKADEKPQPQAKGDESNADVSGADAPPSARARNATAERDGAGDEMVARAQNYLYGKGVPRNCDQALMLLKSAASHGNPRTSSQLGAMYATGNCVAIDRPTAYRWFSAAANAEPGNIYVERNRDMIWREMSADERQRAQ